MHVAITAAVVLVRHDVESAMQTLAGIVRTAPLLITLILVMSLAFALSQIRRLESLAIDVKVSLEATL